MMDDIVKQVKAAALKAYGDEELVDEFMDHFHTGSIAKAVLGNDKDFVCPSNITSEQLPAMLKYLGFRRMSGVLGEVWKASVELYSGNENMAEIFLLNRNFSFGQPLFDVVLSGPEGRKQVLDYFSKVDFGVHT